MGKRGPKLKLTREVHKQIVKHLRVGAFKKHAAEAAGVGASTLERWLKAGREGDKDYEAFAIDVMKAEAEYAVRLTATVTRAVVTDWRAAAWLLERKFPASFGRAAMAVGVSIGGEGGGNEEPHARVHFYLPQNGRRPGDVGYAEAGYGIDDDGTES